MDNFTGEIREFKSPEDYADFKEKYWSKENLDYMNFVSGLEQKYGNSDFRSLLGSMSDKEYEKFKTLENANPMKSKMAAYVNNDWENAIPRFVSKEERKNIVEYAEGKGIKIGSIKNFDGDPDLVKSQIDTLEKLQTMLPLGKQITYSVSSMDDDDFGATTQTHISVNIKAVRNRRSTIFNILNGGQFASRDVEDIVAHEYGHVFVLIKGNKGLEIASKAYYNVYNTKISEDELLAYLNEYVSPYSITKRNYPEIIPEILAKNNSDANDFTVEFVRLLKGL